MYSCVAPCIKRLNFFKVNSLEPITSDVLPVARWSSPSHIWGYQMDSMWDFCHTSHHPWRWWSMQQHRNPTTSFLTAATLIYTIGAGITAAAGTRLALQLFLVKVFKLFSFQTWYPLDAILVFLVTTSPCWHWVNCAPAAFLRSGGHLSGPLSGTEP